MKLLPMVILTATLFSNLLKMEAQISSYFNLGDESWTALTEGLLPPPSASWTAINGNPTGCFKATDQAAGTWYYNSPAAFNTDLSYYYGDNLQFDLKQNTSTFQTNEPDVMICKADGSKIVYSTPVNPGTSWTSYTVPLMETGWKYTTLAGLPVTYTDMMSFLTNVYRIKIRGDYSSITTETDWLDNVVITLPILLPIELISFECAINKSSTASLSWETLSENNCSYFQVEKSNNNGMSFDSIGTIPAQGTTAESTNYLFHDTNFYTDAFFRLKSVDFDNSNSYSDIIFSKYIAANNLIKIYPNPTTNYITIEQLSGGKMYGSIVVKDALKNIVIIKNNMENGSSINVDLSSLSNGIYYVSIINDNMVNTYPIEVIQ